MKGKIVKQLHQVGVYRDPITKQKLETMKLAYLLNVREEVMEQIKNGERSPEKYVEKYEFVKVVKKEKVVGGKKKK